MPQHEVEDQEQLVELEALDEQQFAESAPVGQFSKKSLNNLVKSTNKLLPAFGQSPDYPEFKEDATSLPTDFVRVLGMFASATISATEGDVISPELVVDIDIITDDHGLTLTAGKLDALSRDKSFKKWLKEPAPTSEQPPPEEVSDEPSDLDVDALFEERL